MLPNPFHPAVRADPYPTFAALRAEDPVHYLRFPGIWLLTRYADVAAALRDERLSAVRRLPAGPSPALAQLWSRNLLVLDPPDHTRIRGLVNRAFTPRVVERLRDRIQAHVDELLDAVAPRGGMDLIADLAGPLPVIVIAELLGVPVADRDRLRRWSDDLSPTLDRRGGWAHLPQAERSAAELCEYFAAVFAERRARPRDDLVSALVAAHEAGDRLSEEELYATCLLLLAAGDETATNLIGNGTLALLRHPDELARLRQEPGLIRSAVEEILRYDSPVQLSARTAREDVEIGGKTIPRGADVVLALGAANRDPAQFPEPDRLDLGRTENRHVAFGHGIHFCIGAQLGRVEGQITLQTLVRRFPGLRLAGEPAWRTNFSLRGLATLPVTF